jgi:hypothetical protein
MKKGGAFSDAPFFVPLESFANASRPLGENLGWGEGEHFYPGFGNGNGVFKLGRELAIHR